MMLEWVWSKIGNANLEKMVLTGCSAGGLVANYWTHYITEFLEKLLDIFGEDCAGNE